MTVLLDRVQHKVLTYVEYRAVPGVFQNVDPPPPLHPASGPPPAPKAGGTHLPGSEGGGRSIFWKTPAIGLASYSLISLRCMQNEPEHGAGGAGPRCRAVPHAQLGYSPHPGACAQQP